MPLEGQGRWLEVGEVSRVVDFERRSVKSRDFVGICSDFQDFQGTYDFRRSEKVVGGRRGLKGSGS